MKIRNTTYAVEYRDEGVRGPWWSGLGGMAVIAAFGLVSLAWFRGEWSAVAGYDFATSLKPLDEIRRALNIWDDRLYAGAPNYIAVATLPYLLLQYAFERAAGSLYRGQMLFFTLLFLLPGFGMRAFLRSAFEGSKTRDEAAFFGALFYMLNTFVFVKWNRGELIALFAYGMLPLYLTIVDRGLRGPLNARFVAVFICALFFYPASLGHSADFLISTGLVCGYALWLAASSRDAKVLKRALILAVAAVAVSSWWALPFLSSLGHGGSFAASFAGDEANLVDYYSSWARLLNVMKLWFSPIYPTSVEFGLQFYRPGSILIPLLAFSALLFRRDGRVLFFAFTAIAGLWLSKGTAPPFGGLYRWLYHNVPYFFVFRAPSRCFPLVYTLSLSVLIGHSASSMLARARSSTRGRRLAKPFGAVVVFIIIFNAWPLLYRDSVFRTSRADNLYPSVFVDIPPYYEELNGWIKKRIGGYRLHSFHDRTYLNYTWGYSSTDIAPRLIEAPQTLKFSQELNFGSGGFHEMMSAFTDRFWSWDFGRADRILGLFGVKYIFSTKDVMRRYLPDTNYYDILPGALESMDGIRRVKEIGPATVYENRRALPMVYGGRHAKALLADPESIVTLSYTDYLDRPLLIRAGGLDQIAGGFPAGSLDELVIADRNFWDVLSGDIPKEYRVVPAEGAAFRSTGGLYRVMARVPAFGRPAPIVVRVDGAPVSHGDEPMRHDGIEWKELGVIDVPQGWHNVSIEPSNGARELIFVPMGVWESRKRRVEEFFRDNTLPRTDIFRERASASGGFVLPVYMAGPYRAEAALTPGRLFKEKSFGLSEKYLKAPDLIHWSVFGGGRISSEAGIRISPGPNGVSIRAAKRFDSDSRGYVDLEEYPYLSIAARSERPASFDAGIVLGIDFDNDGKADDAVRLGPFHGNGAQQEFDLARIIRQRYGYPGKPSYRAVWVLIDMEMKKGIESKGRKPPALIVEGVEFYRYVPATDSAPAHTAVEISGNRGAHRSIVLDGTRPASFEAGRAGETGLETIVVKTRSKGNEARNGTALRDVVVKVFGNATHTTATGENLDVDWKRLGPSRYIAAVKRAEKDAHEPFWIVLNVSYDRGWKAYLLKDGRRRPVNDHYVMNGFANGWWVKDASGAEATVVMEFEPQRRLFWGAAASIFSSMLIISIAMTAPGVKRRGRRRWRG